MRLISKLILIYFVIEIAIFLGVSAIPSTNPIVLHQFNQLENSVTHTSYFGKVLTIFPHNLLIATIDFIPIIGLIFFGMSIADTGYVVSVYSTAHGFPGILAAISLLLLPHSAVELPSYAIAVGSGTYMLIRWKDWKRSLLTYIVVPVELFFAALIESALFYVSDPFILWFASIPVLVGIYFLYEKIQKYADKISVVTPGVSYYSQFYYLYKDALNRALAYEAQGQIALAIDSYWSAILYILDAIAQKLGLPYLSKEDLYRVVQIVSNYYPQVLQVFNKVQVDFQVVREPWVLGDLKYLANTFENAYFNPTIRAQ